MTMGAIRTLHAQLQAGVHPAAPAGTAGAWRQLSARIAFCRASHWRPPCACRLLVAVQAPTLVALYASQIQPLTSHRRIFEGQSPLTALLRRHVLSVLLQHQRRDLALLHGE